MNPVLYSIRVYRKITTWLRLAQVPWFIYTPCKFYPSCSEYAELAIQEYGPIKGSWKSLGRIIRCNPLSSGGVDYPK